MIDRPLVRNIDINKRPSKEMNHPYCRSPDMVPQPIPIPALSSSPRVVVASVSPPSRPSFLRTRDSITTLNAIRQPKVLHPSDNEDLRLLILENISQEAVRYFRSQGFHVDHYTTALSESELLEKIPQYHAIGIRSKTRITEKVIKAATKVCIVHLPVTRFSLLASSSSFLSSVVSASGPTRLTSLLQARLASPYSTLLSPILDLSRS